MPTPDDFRARLRIADVETIVREFILIDDAVHVPTADRNYIRDAVSGVYAQNPNDVKVCIVGSAKLGFSLIEKRLSDGTIAPRYRAFGPDSDIDVAIVGPGIFDQIWHELSMFAHKASYFPWDSKKLGDYLVCGWLRPDWFPINVRLAKCDEWWDCFRGMSAGGRLGRRKISGGLFYSEAHLIQYHSRSVAACVRAEEILP